MEYTQLTRADVLPRYPPDVALSLLSALATLNAYDRYSGRAVPVSYYTAGTVARTVLLLYTTSTLCFG